MNRHKLATTLIFTLFLIGCGGSNLKVERFSPDSDPSAELSKLEASLNFAREHHAETYSPNWYRRAETGFESAKDMITERRPRGAILAKIAQTKAELERVNQNVALTEKTIPNAIEARNAARDAGATTFIREYNVLEDDFFELTRAIERGNVRDAKDDEMSVARKFRDLELKAIKENLLGEARKIINKMESLGAKKFVPQTFRNAYNTLQRADQFISKNRQDKAELNRHAREALFEANRLANIFGLAQKLERQTPEKSARYIETILYTLGRELSAPDMRDQILKTQVANLRNTIAELRKDQGFSIQERARLGKVIETLKAEKASLEGKTQMEQAALARMEADEEFRKKYALVRRFFTPEEAEIYKDGDRLIIRMRSLTFPSGQHVVLPQNYKILSKVQRSIRTFPNPNVVIEGHTDSTGSDTMNDHLSQQRAQSVKQYLVANETLSGSKITALGYGSSRPIAPNTSPQGRAMNRRIDVIIEPTAK